MLNQLVELLESLVADKDPSQWEDRKTCDKQDDWTCSLRTKFSNSASSSTHSVRWDHCQRWVDAMQQVSMALDADVPLEDAVIVDMEDGYDETKFTVSGHC